MEVAPLPPVYPVILCGGAGERLWPASRPWRPKPFLALAGESSGLQAAARRATPLVQGGGELIVIGSADHEALIAEQLAGCAAQVLLEPQSRNTAAAIAVAAAWASRRAPDARLVILPADHHLPDAPAFHAAIATALGAAGDGLIVTLGVRPTAPATAYGYILAGPGAGDVRPVARFVEKPDEAAAAALIAEGALWNSGIFVATAATLRAALAQHAPEVFAAAEAAVDAEARGRLGAALAGAPSVAFDRAVMEPTDRAAVVPVAFPWSDLGSWAAVADAAGATAAEPFVQAAPGIAVSVVGLTDVVVVAEPDAVLVAARGSAQAVRDPSATDGPPARYRDLGAAAEGYDLWLRTAALPLWATVGVDAAGGFREALTWDGRLHDPRRRTRVQARQVFVFADAAAEGAPGPWLAAARSAMAWFPARARRADGLYVAALDLDGRPLDPEARLYEQAFVLLALAGLRRADPHAEAAEAEAAALRARLDSFRHAAGGFREAGDAPFQANAQMHLFEAALAWTAVGGDAGWAALADELATLALTRFLDPETGALGEFYEADWTRRRGEAGLVEPGHQFEWAWLLAQWSAQRREPGGEAAARRLYAVGRRGWDARRGVVVNALWDDLSVRDDGARLWPQTEHIKAALALGDEATALAAANGLARYLDTPARGVWRERMRPDGGFIAEPSPATSLYHLYLAIRELRRWSAEPC